MRRSFGGLVPRQSNPLLASSLLAFLLVLAAAGPALAIPSPELVVGSFTSVSQLIALASAFIGGGAALVTMRTRGSRNAGWSPRRIGIAACGVLLLIVSVAFNIYQHVDHNNERQARLEETLLRPSRAPAGSADDPDQKELTFSEQLRHPLRMSTDEADKLLTATARGERDDLVFLDVREAAEREMGTLPGVRFVRFPDLASAKIDFTGKRAVLFCHNGNRSSETCEALAKMGIDCRFIVGGLEKWVVENRPMEGLAARSLEQLRAIPEYRNRSTLLDTPTVRRLINDDKAMMVDIRYPTDFAQQHIPGAINLSLRRMPTPELQQRIADLPKRPIVLPCYDRRGCFFAEVLGYELTRAGHDVRGRYTLPWEYFVARPRPPHVEQWLAESKLSLWTKAGRYFSVVLLMVGQWTSLVGAILLLALLSRLLVLPFSLKAERDQIRSRAVSDELAALKARLKDDPVRRTRAISEFYNRHGLTPLRNLVALMFLPIMALGLIGVQGAAAAKGGGFLWIPDLAARDPLLVLPVLFGASISLYIDRAFVRRITHRVVTWTVAFPLLVATGALFSAGAGLYLFASAAMLLIQRAAVDGFVSKMAGAWRRIRLPGGMVSLDDPERLSGHGNKAYRLGLLRRQGMPVPDGILLTPGFLTAFAAGTPARRQKQLDRLWARLGGVALAVRSSFSAEDDARHSFAGIFETVLNVERSGLEAAILQVIGSFKTERAASYAAGGGRAGVLVQRMVQADYAGVLFTRDPAAAGLAMVELVRGTAEELVAGAVRPETHRFGRSSGQGIGDTRPAIDLAPLLALGRKAEALFGLPQDIEWVYRGGRFSLVQSRDITANLKDAGPGLGYLELARLFDLTSGAAPDEVVFAKNELSEMLPRPTPISLSLMTSMWAGGGSLDLAARALGISCRMPDAEADPLVTIRGRLYINRHAERGRVMKIGPLAARRLIRTADDIEQNFRAGFLPGFLREIRLAEVADLDRLSTPDLFDALAQRHEKFVKDTHVEVDIVNIAADFCLQRARKKLATRGLDASAYLGRIPETHVGRLLADAAGGLPDARAALLSQMGHRAVLDYELAEPRYAEDAAALDRYASMALRTPPHRMDEGEAVTGLDKGLAAAIRIARRFSALKEDAKHHSLRELALLRRLVLAIDRRLALDGLSFFLRLDELLSLRDGHVDALVALAAERSAARIDLLGAPSPGSALTVRDLETLSAGGAVVEHGDEMLRGTRVSGSGLVEGRARSIADSDTERGAEIAGFEDGDIIVASMIHPAWLPYFSRAGGLVCEIGGWLSHTAILAREYDLAMLVGTRNLESIADGDLLRLHPDGRVDNLGQRPISRSIAAE